MYERKDDDDCDVYVFNIDAETTDKRQVWLDNNAENVVIYS